MAKQKYTRAEKCALTQARNRTRKEENIKRAAIIAEKRNKRTDQQQLDHLDKFGFVAKKERTKILFRMNSK